MECRNARLLLEFARPGSSELDAVEAEALNQHLSECPDCSALAQFERRVDDHLGRAMRDVPVPAGLRERILGKLAGERSARNRRWLLRASGAAAAVLLLGLTGWYLWSSSLPALTPNDVPYLVDAAPFPRKGGVEVYFDEINAKTELPPGFKYELLQSYDLAILHGRQVPQLVFVSDGKPADVARVYVLSERQFDLEQTKRNFANLSGGGHRDVKLIEHSSEAGQYLYLVIYPSGKLPLFRSRRAEI